VLLSVKAGLRAMEIALVQRRHVTDGDGAVVDLIHLEDKLCKKGSGRTIPMHPLLREAIVAMFSAYPHCPANTNLVRSERAYRDDPSEPGAGRSFPMSPKSIGRLFARAFADLGMEGCSSHSGRRTFITRVARKIADAGGSMRDVQQLAGHQNLNVTQSYIEGDSEAKRRVVEMI